MESPVPDRDQASRFTGVRVLIIEDETAIDMLDRTPPSIAVLDINLGGEKSYAVAEALAKRGIKFVFSTGYADGRLQPPWQDRPVLQKPFGQEQLAEALEFALKA